MASKGNGGIVAPHSDPRNWSLSPPLLHSIPTHTCLSIPYGIPVSIYYYCHVPCAMWNRILRGISRLGWSSSCQRDKLWRSSSQAVLPWLQHGKMYSIDFEFLRHLTTWINLLVLLCFMVKGGNPWTISAPRNLWLTLYWAQVWWHHLKDT